MGLISSVFNGIWMFPKIGVPQNGWSMVENPIKTDDLGVPLFFLETYIKPSQVKAGRNMTVFCAHVCSAVAVSAQGPGWH